MLKGLVISGMLSVLCLSAVAVERRHGVLVGTVARLDASAKTMVVRLADGTEHTLHFVTRTAVHGIQGTAVGAKDAFRGLKEGSEVAVHYSAVGVTETAEEVDRISADGLKATEGTITKVGQGAKTMTVKTADGAETTFRMTDRAATDAGKDVGKAAEKSGKVTVYYSEEGGRKIVHFLKRAI